MNITTNKTQKAFSLMELAIAIAVIATLMSAIGFGKSLKRHAEIRQVVSDLYNYEALFKSFRDAYTQYPGDFSLAHDYFGDACDTTAAECNGDGDGYIESGSAGDQQRESHRLWQHLNLSDMLPGNYPGFGGISSPTTSPVGALKESIYFVDNTGDISGNVENKLFITGYYSSSEYQGIMPVSSARSIDKKMDDGIANTGVIFGISGVSASSTDCSAARGTAGADYNLDSTIYQACYIAYLF